MFNQLKSFAREEKVNLISLALAILFYNVLKIDLQVVKPVPFVNVFVIAFKLTYLYLLFILLKGYFVKRWIKD